ncbi:MAG: peptidoglycan DD-metalloendopeptidase family protein [Deltaproteobacteria bacterium]
MDENEENGIGTALDEPEDSEGAGSQRRHGSNESAGMDMGNEAENFANNVFRGAGNMLMDNFGRQPNGKDNGSKDEDKDKDEKKDENKDGDKGKDEGEGKNKDKGDDRGKSEDKDKEQSEDNKKDDSGKKEDKPGRSNAGSYAKGLGQKAVSGGKKLAQKGARMASNGGKALSQGLKMGGKAIAKAAAGAVASLGTPVIIIILIVIIALVIVFFSIETQKAYAYTVWGNLIEDYCKSAENSDYSSRGYTTVGGISKQDFEKLVREPDGIIFTGQLPFEDDLTEEEKKKLEEDNKERDQNFKEVSTDEERKRIKAYLQAERDSTLKAMEKQEKQQGNIFTKFLKFFKDEEPSPEPSTSRLNFKNHDYDFGKTDAIAAAILSEDAMLEDNRSQIVAVFKQKIQKLENSTSQADKDELKRIKKQKAIIEDTVIAKYLTRSELAKKIQELRDYIEDVKEQVFVNEDRIKDLNEKKLVISSKSGTSIEDCTEADIRKDELFKQIEPHALQWELLYLIDKAIDEDEFEDFKDLEDPNADPEEVYKSIKEKFIKRAIPEFKPKFEVIRHMTEKGTRATRYSWWPPKDEDDPGSSSDSWSTQEFKPMYTLEWYDDWSKTQSIPMAEKLVYDYTRVATDSSCPSGSDNSDTTIDVVPVPYDGLMTVGQIISGSKEEKSTKSGNVTTTTCHYEEIVSIPDKKPELKDKKEKVRKLLEEEYKIDKYDVEHALYLSQYAPEFLNARYELARIFDLSLGSSMYGGSGFGGFVANIQYLIDHWSGRAITKMLQDPNGLNVELINSECAKNGLPAAAVVAQMIYESAWGESGLAVKYHNLSGITGTGPAGCLEVVGGDGVTRKFRKYNTDIEWFYDYIKLITGEYPYAVQAAATGGAEAYIYALNSVPGHMYCPDSGYADQVIQIMNENQLIQEGTDMVIQAGGWPLETQYRTVTSKYGMRVHPTTGEYKMHTGIDIGAPGDARVLATADGYVSAVQLNTSTVGTTIKIEHGGNVATRYVHLRPNITVSVGDKVTAGQVIGYIAGTKAEGGSFWTGAHLHFEVYNNGNTTDPQKYLP